MLLKNDETIYHLSDLTKLAKEEHFPFKSRLTITKLAEKGFIPAHRSKAGEKQYRWWFVGKELVEWMNERVGQENTEQDNTDQ